MKIAIHGRTLKEESLIFIKDMFEELSKNNIDVQLSQTLATALTEFGIKVRKIKDIFNDSKDIFNADILLSIGGDGTLLESITYVKDKNIPILGINTGRMGFLATITPSNLGYAIECILNGYYEIDERTLVHLESDRDLFEGINFGLNEFAILKRDTSSMITVHTFINGEYLNSYWADGIILSTPTGSTGYSLSVGGPLVLPHSNNFILSPVSPHNLSVRPLVIPDDKVISFEIEGRSKNFLVSLDSRSRAVEGNVQLAVRKENFKAKLIRINGYNFLDTLRYKLNWGWDVRN
ncbi:MAG TPA: NAD kinase [Cytophagales bacterium]|nr:NAD kinase [Cytophagales bacterium]